MKEEVKPAAAQMSVPSPTPTTEEPRTKPSSHRCVPGHLHQARTGIQVWAGSQLVLVDTARAVRARPGRVLETTRTRHNARPKAHGDTLVLGIVHGLGRIGCGECVGVRAEDLGIFLPGRGSERGVGVNLVRAGCGRRRLRRRGVRGRISHGRRDGMRGRRRRRGDGHYVARKRLRR